MRGLDQRPDSGSVSESMVEDASGTEQAREDSHVKAIVPKDRSARR